MSAQADVRERLERRLQGLGAVAVAVSGGVDSMTLAVIAHRVLGERATMFHARSPAVPEEATARVERYAADRCWRLRIIDAEEFSDPSYLANPVNRCFHCKRNLYDAITAHTDGVVVSGTNLDDLSDFRPGLDAARERGVRHPYVEELVDKEGVRALARWLRLDDLAELPAAPCLSSRIETGLAIRPAELAVVHRIEREIAESFAPKTVRCRRRSDTVVIELDDDTLAGLSPTDAASILERADALWRAAGVDARSRLEPYRRGSAFLST
jgi:uncharacterized protein